MKVLLSEPPICVYIYATLFPLRTTLKFIAYALLFVVRTYKLHHRALCPILPLRSQLGYRCMLDIDTGYLFISSVSDAETVGHDAACRIMKTFLAF